MNKKFAVVEKQFEYKGHDCVCVFTKNGTRNGYVSTNKQVDYKNLDIYCHGGLTFSNPLHKDYNPKKSFYLGFDCNHIYDAHDYEQAMKYGLITEAECFVSKKCMPNLEDTEMRSLDYVIENCKYIVDQLEEDE